MFEEEPQDEGEVAVQNAIFVEAQMLLHDCLTCYILAGADKDVALASISELIESWPGWNAEAQAVAGIDQMRAGLNQIKTAYNKQVFEESVMSDLDDLPTLGKE